MCRYVIICVYFVTAVEGRRYSVISDVGLFKIKRCDKGIFIVKRSAYDLVIKDDCLSIHNACVFRLDADISLCYRKFKTVGDERIIFVGTSRFYGVFANDVTRFVLWNKRDVLFYVRILVSITVNNLVSVPRTCFFAVNNVVVAYASKRQGFCHNLQRCVCRVDNIVGACLFLVVGSANVCAYAEVIVAHVFADGVIVCRNLDFQILQVVVDYSFLLVLRLVENKFFAVRRSLVERFYVSGFRVDLYLITALEHHGLVNAVNAFGEFVINGVGHYLVVASFDNVYKRRCVFRPTFVIQTIFDGDVTVRSFHFHTVIIAVVREFGKSVHGVCNGDVGNLYLDIEVVIARQIVFRHVVSVCVGNFEAYCFKRIVERVFVGVFDELVSADVVLFESYRTLYSVAVAKCLLHRVRNIERGVFALCVGEFLFYFEDVRRSNDLNFVGSDRHVVVFKQIFVCDRCAKLETAYHTLCVLFFRIRAVLTAHESDVGIVTVKIDKFTCRRLNFRGAIGIDKGRVIDFRKGRAVLQLAIQFQVDRDRSLCDRDLCADCVHDVVCVSARCAYRDITAYGRVLAVLGNVVARADNDIVYIVAVHDRAVRDSERVCAECVAVYNAHIIDFDGNGAFFHRNLRLYNTVIGEGVVAVFVVECAVYVILTAYDVGVVRLIVG